MFVVMCTNLFNLRLTHILQIAYYIDNRRSTWNEIFATAWVQFLPLVHLHRTRLYIVLNQKNNRISLKILSRIGTFKKNSSLQISSEIFLWQFTLLPWNVSIDNLSYYNLEELHKVVGIYRMYCLIIEIVVVLFQQPSLRWYRDVMWLQTDVNYLEWIVTVNYWLKLTCLSYTIYKHIFCRMSSFSLHPKTTLQIIGISPSLHG